MQNMEIMTYFNEIFMQYFNNSVFGWPEVIIEELLQRHAISWSQSTSAIGQVEALPKSFYFHLKFMNR